MKIILLLAVHCTISFAFQGCKCSQIMLQVDCENPLVPCKWSNGACSLAACSDRILDKNCYPLTMFTSKSETDTCLPIVAMTKCMTLDELKMYPCDQLPFPASVNQENYPQYCQSWFCNYNSVTNKCVSLTNSCPDVPLAQCLYSYGGSDRTVQGGCTWLNSKCVKEDWERPPKCSDLKSRYTCSAFAYCVWSDTVCKNQICSDFDGLDPKYCNAIIDVGDTYGTRICTQQTDQSCQVDDPGMLSQNVCMSRTYNLYFWNTSTSKCEACDPINQYKEVEDSNYRGCLFMGIIFIIILL